MTTIARKNTIIFVRVVKSLAVIIKSTTDHLIVTENFSSCYKK